MLLITASVLDVLLDVHGVHSLASLTAIVNCGENFVATIANRCVSMLPGAQLMNMYGATEASCPACQPEWKTSQSSGGH